MGRDLPRRMSLLLARTGHGVMSDLSLLSGVKRKSGFQVRWDPERTSLFLATNILRWARRHKVGRARSLCGLQSNFLTAAIFGYRMVSDCANAGAFYETGTNRVL